jgi:hypothetical protein
MAELPAEVIDFLSAGVRVQPTKVVSAFNVAV